MRKQAEAARRAAAQLACAPGATRTAAIRGAATLLRAREDHVLEANRQDMAAAEAAGLAPSFLDRLRLDAQRIEDMAGALEEIASQSDPVGELVEERVRPNGLRVARQRIPLGVICMIYEARPNVTSDAAALCLRSGNSVLLKGGSAAAHSNAAIGEIMQRAAAEAGLPESCITILEPSDREGLQELLTLDDLIDVVIPRGGAGLIRHVSEHSRIPVIRHFEGICHVYLHADAPLERARSIVVNAKAQRPGVCNAAEALLVHADAAPRLLPPIAEALGAAGVTLHTCPRSQAVLGNSSFVVPASESDWGREYLSLDLAVRVVDSLVEATEFIARHGSGHTEAIVTDSIEASRAFIEQVSSSCVMVNASTRFADGGELGLGAEIGISTSKLHAYGPMGARELTTTRFIVTGNGQTR